MDSKALQHSNIPNLLSDINPLAFMNIVNKLGIVAGESACGCKLFARLRWVFFYELSTIAPAFRRIDRMLVGI